YLFGLLAIGIALGGAAFTKPTKPQKLTSYYWFKLNANCTVDTSIPYLLEPAEDDPFGCDNTSLTCCANAYSQINPDGTPVISSFITSITDKSTK
ncbi:MAG TPA: hypothetical protein VGM41_08165, partial [Chitinophagaceae bacterium]